MLPTAWLAISRRERLYSRAEKDRSQPPLFCLVPNVFVVFEVSFLKRDGVCNPVPNVFAMSELNGHI